ncbi:MAG: ABC-F family ATP-binding cassette domain-containing protein, partial [Bdellovibrionales bacterium]|nr:ABC-F family ATP-binding cassette domain-containing protein [Oligoflexia bacterium]
SGKVSKGRGLKIGYLPQTPELNLDLTAREAIYESVTSDEDWNAISAAEEAMSRLRISPDIKCSDLSGGWRKKVALAKELAKNPDVLLLDEPTNHLDVESILWLEDWVRNSQLCIITISHDRSFLNRVGSRVIEIDRRNPGGILSVDGNYEHFVGVKEEYIQTMISREESLKNVLRREVEWLGRGAKARSTKQKARIDRAEELKLEVSDLSSKNATQSLKLEFDNSDRGPRKLVELKDVFKAYGDKKIINNFSLRITPKTRLGLMGMNGVGKSTLIRLISGTEAPDSGAIEHADRLQVSYFEQNRESLDPSLSVLRTVCPYGETVEFQGRLIHVRGYLDRFLFSGPQVDVKVEKLSGGEQSRLLLALLMLRPANLLILDEPTNDLDMQTLAVLEDCLDEFPGAVILVTHDRSFMNAVSNQILAMPEMIFFTDIDQWEKWFKAELKKKSPEKIAGSAQSVSIKSKKKLSYKDQLEYDNMESALAKKETRLAEVDELSANPEVSSNASELQKLSAEMGALHTDIEQLYARWAELEAKAK